MPRRLPAPSLQALVAGLVDYAGLFPPAALPMGEAVAAYASYLDAPETWILGRFVVPVARLPELAAEAARYTGAHTEPWLVAALPGADLAADLATVQASNASHAGRLHVDVLEVKTPTPEAVREAARLVDGAAMLYLEVPVAGEPRPLLEAVRVAGARAKVRTGGVTADAFPASADLARFIVRCAEVGVAFKATAGLHHPLRAEHPLTYDADAACGTMFGFLNVFAAAAFAQAGAGEDTVRALLDERDPAALRFDGDQLAWREELLTVDQLHHTRESFAISFGSCSFREPVDDLHRLALL